MSNEPRTPLGAAMARYRRAFVTVALLSALLNILLLGGSIFMMLVYDSVLPSRSVPTLVGLLAMVAAVFAFQGAFDAMRTRLLTAAADGLDRDLSPQIQRAIFESRRRGVQLPGDGLTLMRDFDQLRAFLSGPGPGTLIDLPWILFFLVILGALHLWLGFTALVGALVLIALAFLTNRQTRQATLRLSQVAALRNGMAETMLRHTEILIALGMRRRFDALWTEINETNRVAQTHLAKRIGLYAGAGRIARMFLQSLILAVGALLVIDGKASGGVIFASAILSGRALAPIDSAIANWRGFAAARLGWRRVNELLRSTAAEATELTRLPAPARDLTVENLVVAPPGTQVVTVNGVSFGLAAGEALGIVGPSAAGKTSLGRALMGVWQPVRGSVRLDGAALEQWPADTLGEHLGYLPQTVELIEGTVAQNIARFEAAPDADAVIAAAQAAGVHELIVRLPQGYETPVGPDGKELSAGQRQRVGLARALYRDPFLVLLDEPNSNLDAAGEEALQRAVAEVRARGGIAVLIAHRPTALAQVSHVLVMQAGRVDAFGPRDEILPRITQPPAAAAGPVRRDAPAPRAEIKVLP